jgi:hypothetical protein
MKPHERAAAWLITGPLGHLLGGLIDWSTAIGRLLLARVTGRRFD